MFDMPRSTLKDKLNSGQADMNALINILLGIKPVMKKKAFVKWNPHHDVVFLQPLQDTFCKGDQGVTEKPSTGGLLGKAY
jgi:hypothetical protein